MKVIAYNLESVHKVIIFSHCSLFIYKPIYKYFSDSYLSKSTLVICTNRKSCSHTYERIFDVFLDTLEVFLINDLINPL